MRLTLSEVMILNAMTEKNNKQVLLQILFWSFVVLTGVVAGMSLLTISATERSVIEPSLINKSDLKLPEDLNMTKQQFRVQNDTLDGRYLHSDDSDMVVLIAHDCQGTLYEKVPLYRAFKELGLSVYTFDYRRYGLSEGNEETASDEDFYVDTYRAFQKLQYLKWKSSEILLYGQGLGATFQAEVAAKVSCAGWIAENPWPSFSSMMNDPFRRLLMKDRFVLMNYFPKITTPKLVLFGSDHPKMDEKHMKRAINWNPLNDSISIIQGGNQRLLVETQPEQWKNAVSSFLKIIRSKQEKVKKIRGRTKRNPIIKRARSRNNHEK